MCRYSAILHVEGNKNIHMKNLVDDCVGGGGGTVMIYLLHGYINHV